ncbi:1-acyl-sn-glycerol-3-phosphate acyltransferase [Maribacter sp. 2210JD10-5]|uniref:1-acyl-sn-glycerol-3-phosphate acyltransferase n=1 Tax=Maribacter sp. 2210JD10-5 TaxID=3386272 RepID=UPI0039BC3AC5
MGDFCYGTYRLIQKNKIFSATVLALLLGILAFFASKIKFEDDITALIPANEETQRVQSVLKSISFTDKIIVNIQKNDNASVDELTQHATDFIDSLQSSHGNYVEKIQGKVDDTEVLKTFDFIYENIPLFLDASDYPNINAKLPADSIQKMMQRHYRTLISPTGIVAKKSILKDPLGISFIALKKLQQLGIAEGFKLKNGFLVNREETNILLFITPTFPSSATVENKPLSDGLYALQEKLKKQYGNTVKATFFGAALVAVANADQVRKDIQLTVSITMTVLVIFLILFYRKIALPLILFMPTIFGALLSIAFLYLYREYISAISLGIGAILLGVTLDYALHILTHIRNGGSIKQLFQEVAPSVLMSSLTTASAFLCLLFLESQALQDLGIFAAISVTGAAIFALLFIPQVYRKKKGNPSKTTFLDRMAGYELHKNKWALAILAIAFTISIFTYNTVGFNKDISKLNYEANVLTTARERLETLTDIGATSVYLATYGMDQEKVMQRNDLIHAELEKLKKDNTIINYTSVGGLVKSNKTQLEKIKDWKRFWTLGKRDTLTKNLIDSGNGLGFKENSFSIFYKWLKKEFQPITLSAYDSVPSLSVNDYIVTDEKGSTTVTSLVKIEASQLETIKEHFKTMPNTLFINRKQVNESFLGTLRNDFNSLLLYSLITVILILFVFYRSVSLTLVTGIPIMLTWFLTVGIMGLLGMEFNIFNIIICSFIFGLGVDYSIFITNGLLTEYRTGEKILPTHKTSIILSVITTIAGVGVMVFAKHPVLSTIAKVSLIGIFSAAFVAFTFQPLLFRLFIGSSKKRPISLRYFVHSVLSFFYFGFSGFLFSIYAWIVMKIDPKSIEKKNLGFHKIVSKLMGSVLYTNPFVKKEIRNPLKETFEKPAMIIANHTSFLDILSIGMLHPKIIFLVNDWVYNSPVFGSAAKLVGAYPVSGGIENGEAYLKEKVAQGFSLIAFPEGTRSTSNKIKRFHKGAFYLAEQFNLDILPVLIHGNSEVLPKGSFVIRDGRITIEILPRITPGNTKYGADYTQKGKLLGAYFRNEFRRLRSDVETNGYWNKTILEHYRFKGERLYKRVKEDLHVNGEIYFSFLHQIDQKESILHISEDSGQLDFLLALDSIDRKIFTFLENPSERALLEHNFLTQQYSRITVLDNIKEMPAIPINVLLLNIKDFNLHLLTTKLEQEINTVILFKASRTVVYEELLGFGFSIHVQSDNFIVLTKKNIH